MKNLFRHWTRNLFEVGDRFVKLYAEPIEALDLRIAEIEAKLKSLKEERTAKESKAKSAARKFWTSVEIKDAMAKSTKLPLQYKEAIDLQYLELIRGDSARLTKFLVKRHKGTVNHRGGEINFPTVFDKQAFQNEFTVYSR